MSEDNEENFTATSSPEPVKVEKPGFVITESPIQLRTNLFRRDSGAVKMLSEDYNLQDTELPSRRASSPEKRTIRNSLVKLLEEQEFARRFSAPEKLRSRRSSSIVKTLSEEQEENQEPVSRRSSRSGSIVKMTSEDNFADDELSRRSSRADSTDLEKRKLVRRGSSVVRMLSEEQHDSDKSVRSEPSDKSDNTERFRKSIDNGYKRSLESISEYKTKLFSTNAFYPSLDSPTLDCLSDFAHSLSGNLDTIGNAKLGANTSHSYLNLLDNTNNSYCSSPRYDSDNKSGEWNYFWSNYNSSMNPYFSNPFLCPSNSAEELSLDSNTTQMDKSGTEKIYFTIDEVNEALHCSQRVVDILKDVLKRSEEKEPQTESIKEEKIQNTETDQKEERKTTASNSCIDVFLNHTGVADILKKVLNKRREVIMPPEESSRRSSGSGWTSVDSGKK